MRSSSTDALIAIDPGREKCGIAVVHSTQGILELLIVPTVDLATTVGDMVSRYQTCTIILGNGTSHREAKDILQSATEYSIHVVDEAHTTEQARIRYWEENPPQGLRRLIPLGLQSPPEPVDAYVAAILAERWLAKQAE